jgi:hypothetical protein
MKQILLVSFYLKLQEQRNHPSDYEELQTSMINPIQLLEDVLSFVQVDNQWHLTGFHTFHKNPENSRKMQHIIQNPTSY